MNSAPEQYNIAAIRDLVRAAFTPQDLRRFCQDRTILQPVLTDFRQNPSLNEMVDVLIDYCQQHLLFATLLSEIRQVNPRQHDKYHKYFTPVSDQDIIPPPAIPSNLPPRSEFIGREAEKALLHEAFALRPNLLSIYGMGGIGKTALALEVAHECFEARTGARPSQGIAMFNGFIWMTAKEQEQDLDNLFDTIARTSGYPGVAQSPIETKQVSIHRLLQNEPYLLIIDNLETIRDKRIPKFLDKLPEPSRALITTREIALPERTRMFSLEDLKKTEALALMRSEGKRLGLRAVEQAQDQVLLRLHQSTSGAPLAIKWAIGQIKQKGQSVDRVMSSLRRARASIFQTIFDNSWELLSNQARHILVAMPLFADSASREAIEAAVDVHDIHELDKALDQLVEMSLLDTKIEPDLTPRYSVHPLTRAHAVAMARDSEDIRLAAQNAFEHVLDYYQRLVSPPANVQVGDAYWDGMFNHAGARSLQPERNNLAYLIRWALTPDLNEVTLGLKNLARLIHWPTNPSRQTIALDLFLPIVHFLNGWGQLDERLELSRMLCEAIENSEKARELEQKALAWLWIDAIGFILREQEKEQELEKSIERGKKAAKKANLDDAMILAKSFEAWKILLHNPKAVTSALEKVAPTLDREDWDSILSEDPVHRIVLSRACYARGYAHKLEGNRQDARKWYVRQLELRRSVNENVTPSLLRMARLDLELGNLQSAQEFIKEAATDPRPRDLASLNYTRALLAEQIGEVQEAIQLAELAQEQHKRFRQHRKKSRYQRLLKRLHQASHAETEKGRNLPHND